MNLLNIPLLFLLLFCILLHLFFVYFIYQMIFINSRNFFIIPEGKYHLFLYFFVVFLSRENVFCMTDIAALLSYASFLSFFLFLCFDCPMRNLNDSSQILMIENFKLLMCISSILYFLFCLVSSSFLLVFPFFSRNSHLDKNCRAKNYFDLLYQLKVVISSNCYYLN